MPTLVAKEARVKEAVELLKILLDSISCVGLVEHDSLCSMGSVFGMRFCAEAIIDEHIAIAAQQKPCHVGFG